MAYLRQGGRVLISAADEHHLLRPQEFDMAGNGAVLEKIAGNTKPHVHLRMKAH